MMNGIQTALGGAGGGERSLRMDCATLIAVILLISTNAHGLGLSLTQIGGTAVNGQGLIGDTVEVAVDLTLEADEVLLFAFPTLAWDLEGGNVLDIVSAQEGMGAAVGNVFLTPIDSNYILLDGPAMAGSGGAGVISRSFPDGTAFLDTQVGTTIMHVGFELFIPLSFDEAYRQEILDNGFPGPVTLRMGVATFRLAGLGTTTLGFFRDPSSTSNTIVGGAQGVVINNDDVEFTDLPVSGVGFSNFQITVIPEPSTALLMGLGLAAMAARRIRHL